MVLDVELMRNGCDSPSASNSQVLVLSERSVLFLWLSCPLPRSNTPAQDRVGGVVMGTNWDRKACYQALTCQLNAAGVFYH